MLHTFSESSEVVHHHPVFVKDTSKYWYKPTISREEGSCYFFYCVFSAEPEVVAGAESIN